MEIQYWSQWCLKPGICTVDTIFRERLAGCPCTIHDNHCEPSIAGKTIPVSLYNIFKERLAGCPCTIHDNHCEPSIAGKLKP